MRGEPTVSSRKTRSGAPATAAAAADGLATAATGTEWQEHARCRSADPSLFFSPNTGETKEERLARERRAKAVCAQCPVRRACLDYALAMREPYGVWGGLTEHERRTLISRRAG